MKIGWIVPGPLDDREGSVRYDRFIIEGLRERGHSVEVVSLPLATWFASLRDDAQRDARRRIAAHKPDVWVEDENAHAWLHGAARWFAGTPRVALVHHLRSDEQLPLPLGPAAAAVERRYLRSVPWHLYVSRTTRDRVARLAGAPLDHTIAAPGGDLRGPRPLWEQRAARLAKSRRLQFLFVGSWTERKGLLPLVKACVRMHRRAPAQPWRLRIVGAPGDQPGYTGSVARALQALPPSRVDLAGRLEGDDLRRAYQSADLLVVPSLYEGLGMVYLEAQGFGLPSVAGNRGGARELVRHEHTGWLVPAGAVRPIEARLWQVLNDTDALARVSRGAWDAFDAWPRWPESVARVDEFLTRVLVRQSDDR